MKFRFLVFAAFATVIVEAAPIRVGIFRGTGSGAVYGGTYYLHAVKIAANLSNPGAFGAGSGVVVPNGGVSVLEFGCQTTTTGSGYCPLNTTHTAPFLAALDSLDVVVFLSNSGMGDIFRDAAERAKVQTYYRAKGSVSLYWSTYRYGTEWPDWEAVHGARYVNIGSSQRSGTIRLDSSNAADADWRFLNRGLADSASLVEQWFSFYSNGDSIRAIPDLKVTSRLDESSLSGGLGGMRAMGDHPLGWYRKLPTGGRFFYLALGYRQQNFADTGSKFIQRQIYNAILWAAGVDSNGVVSVRGAASGKVSNFSDASRIAFAGSALAVSVLHDGPHAVEVRSLDGRLVQARRGEGRVVHTIDNLRSGTVYAVSVTSAGQRFARLVTAP